MNFSKRSGRNYGERRREIELVEGVNGGVVLGHGSAGFGEDEGGCWLFNSLVFICLFY